MVSGSMKTVLLPVTSFLTDY